MFTTAQSTIPSYLKSAQIKYLGNVAASFAFVASTAMATCQFVYGRYMLAQIVESSLSFFPATTLPYLNINWKSFGQGSKKKRARQKFQMAAFFLK